MASKVVLPLAGFILLVSPLMVRSACLGDCIKAHKLEAQEMSRTLRDELEDEDDELHVDNNPNNASIDNDARFSTGDGGHHLITLSDDERPAFKFDSACKEGDDKVKFIISYPDGGPDDVAMLNKTNPIKDAVDDAQLAPVDKCIYFGHMKNDKGCFVAVNGCPGSKNLDVAFRSPRLKHAVFEVVNGIVYAVACPSEKNLKPHWRSTKREAIEEAIESRSMDEQQAEFEAVMMEENLEAPARDHAARHARSSNNAPKPIGPQLLHAKVVVHYDNQFLAFFGKQTLNRMRQIINLSKVMFSWQETLGTRIFLDVFKEYHLVTNLNVNDIYKVVSWANEHHPQDADLYLYFSMLSFKENIMNGPVVGKAAGTATACSRFKGKRSAITEYLQSNGYTAGIVTHESGHIFGMRHDFIASSGLPSITPRFSSDGTKCNNQGSIMDYMNGDQRTIDKWSKCSREDLARYYNKITTHWGGFCLAHVCGDVGHYCYLLNTRPDYNCNHWYFKEYCRTACNSC